LENGLPHGRNAIFDVPKNVLTMTARMKSAKRKSGNYLESEAECYVEYVGGYVVP
jgi:hypothetical protein